jgi:uncharacterized membrane protein YuzA (DUF378 family)
MKGKWNLVFPVFFAFVFVAALLGTWHWTIWTKLAPVIIGSIGLLAVMIEIAVSVGRGRKKVTNDEAKKGLAYTDTKYEDMEFSLNLRRGVRFFIWVLGFFMGIVFMGFHITVPLFTFLYLKVEGKSSWRLSISLGLAFLIFLVLVFDWLLHVPWTEPLLMDWVTT